MARYQSLAETDFDGKRALVRVDYNVPMADGAVSDATRIERSLPTIKALQEKGAKTVLMSHMGRPKGEQVAEFSLAPVAAELGRLIGAPVPLAEDCIGPSAAAMVDALSPGDVGLLENTRFHAGEEKNDPEFAKALAASGDVFVSDAFSAAHRAHASTVGVAEFIPAVAGKAMERELDYLAAALANPTRPMLCVVGGAKVSTKIELLLNLVGRANILVVGGGMANTFLYAKGISVGKSLCEPDLADTAREIMAQAVAKGCEIVLPVDGVVAKEFKAHADHHVVAIDRVGADDMILDLGPDSVDLIAERISRAKTLVWNGPLGAFEIAPFDTATVEAARFAAKLVKDGALTAVAGGGDTVAALNHAKVADDFTYVSTAGGAFLEWLEGKTLPGVEVLSVD
ncbi:MAG: phosphoglycerate kinase [Pseudomonadota bacterium]